MLGLLGAAGCTPHDELVVEVTCATLCPCFADADEQAQCLGECQAELDPALVSDACFGCILTGLNPVLSLRSEVEDTGPAMETTTTSSTFGAVFAPNVLAMAHLYF